jgi:hypothetical protein
LQPPLCGASRRCLPAAWGDLSASDADRTQYWRRLRVPLHVEVGAERGCYVVNSVESRETSAAIFAFYGVRNCVLREQHAGRTVERKWRGVRKNG